MQLRVKKSYIGSAYYWTLIGMYSLVIEQISFDFYKLDLKFNAFALSKVPVWLYVNMSITAIWMTYFSPLALLSTHKILTCYDNCSSKPSKIEEVPVASASSPPEAIEIKIDQISVQQ